MHQAVGLEAIIQPVQPPAAPATHQALASRKLALICAAFTGCWALSGAAYCAIFLDPQPPLGRLGPAARQPGVDPSTDMRHGA